MVFNINTNGAVCIADGGTPRIITIKARENISGGYWVNGSSGYGVVGSGAETYAAADIEGYTVSSVVGSGVIGLALTYIASGTYGPVATRGLFILPVLSGLTAYTGSVLSGQSVVAGSAGTVIALGSSTLLAIPGASAVPWIVPIGRALTSADNSGQFIIVSLNI